MVEGVAAAVVVVLVLIVVVGDEVELEASVYKKNVVPENCFSEAIFMRIGLSRRHVLLLRATFPGRPIFIQFIPGSGAAAAARWAAASPGRGSQTSKTSLGWRAARV